ncbi:MAG: hypothetical protein Q8K40_08450 [Ignavibacteria bacterium]|nr:hypothetical protein [Ignavibacteria bacterium]
MHKFYLDYYWNKGKPYGVKEVDEITSPISYKIVVDPYFKRFTVEKYEFGKFNQMIYDSILLDFRHLTTEHQIAWYRKLINEDNDQEVYLIRNHEDRAILLETITYENHLSRICQTQSAIGTNLSIHRMYYESLGDSFNGVILYDIENRPIMKKIYDFDPVQSEFTELLLEEWNMKPKEAIVHG